MKRFAPLAVGWGVALTIAVPAFAACYATAQYVQAREALAELPTDRERAQLRPQVADAYDDLEITLEAFIATAGQDCTTAGPAKARVDTAAATLVAVTGAEPGDDPWITFCKSTSTPECLEACILGHVCD